MNEKYFFPKAIGLVTIGAIAGNWVWNAIKKAREAASSSSTTTQSGGSSK